MNNDPLQRPWYAVRLFGMAKEDKLCALLDENGITHFVPKEYVVKELNGKRVKKLRPVVSNLVFMRKDKTESEIAELLKESLMPLYVIRKEGKTAYYEIKAREMEEFQIMCNPDLYKTKYLNKEQAMLKKGDMVSVTHGPLKGLSGTLVRVNRQYYLMKSVTDISVLLKVSRWCCEKVES